MVLLPKEIYTYKKIIVFKKDGWSPKVHIEHHVGERVRALGVVEHINEDFDSWLKFLQEKTNNEHRDGVRRKK